MMEWMQDLVFELDDLESKIETLKDKLMFHHQRSQTEDLMVERQMKGMEEYKAMLTARMVYHHITTDEAAVVIAERNTNLAAMDFNRKNSPATRVRLAAAEKVLLTAKRYSETMTKRRMDAIITKRKIADADNVQSIWGN